jgi:hypothetical protein
MRRHGRVRKNKLQKRVATVFIDTVLKKLFSRENQECNLNFKIEMAAMTGHGDGLSFRLLCHTYGSAG